MKVRVALIGNPNVGKSVVFNNLTGLKQHTGNWPGKTVEQKTGFFEYKGHEFEIVDLPGVYSLSALSEDERVARDYLIHTRPDVVVDIVNASQVERNLYLTLLLVELQLNLVVVLNMYDVVRSRGDKIDTQKLSEKLGTKVVTTVATKGEGMDDLKEAILEAAEEHALSKERYERADLHLPGDINGGDHLHYHPREHHHGEYERLKPPRIKYSTDIERKLKRILEILRDEREILDRFPPRWLALRILERDPDVMSLIGDEELQSQLLEVTV